MLAGQGFGGSQAASRPPPSCCSQGRSACGRRLRNENAQPGVFAIVLAPFTMVVRGLGWACATACSVRPRRSEPDNTREKNDYFGR
jgi:hypothetical protein